MLDSLVPWTECSVWMIFSARKQTKRAFVQMKTASDELEDSEVISDEDDSDQEN